MTSLIIQWLVVALAVMLSVIWLLQKLTPLSVKIKLAHYLNGKVSDRIRIWLVGHSGCGQCQPASVEAKSR